MKVLLETGRCIDVHTVRSIRSSIRLWRFSVRQPRGSPEVEVGEWKLLKVIYFFSENNHFSRKWSLFHINLKFILAGKNGVTVEGDGTGAKIIIDYYIVEMKIEKSQFSAILGFL